MFCTYSPAGRVCADDVALRAARANTGPEPPPCLTEEEGAAEEKPGSGCCAGAVPVRARHLGQSPRFFGAGGAQTQPARLPRSNRSVGRRGRRRTLFWHRLDRALASFTLISALSCSPLRSVPDLTPAAVPQNPNVPVPCPPSAPQLCRFIPSAFVLTPIPNAEPLNPDPAPSAP